MSRFVHATPADAIPDLTARVHDPKVITPHARADPNAAKVITFLEKAFGGKVGDRYEGPGGTVAHAEVMIDGSVFMLGDVAPGLDPMPAALSYYVKDVEAVDAAYQRALEAGATSVQRTSSTGIARPP
jgi:PhnB protein